MNHINSIARNCNILDVDELAALRGGDMITQACVVYGTAVYASGGALLGNPVGAGAAAFCVGYGVGKLLANLL